MGMTVSVSYQSWENFFHSLYTDYDFVVVVDKLHDEYAIIKWCVNRQTGCMDIEFNDQAKQSFWLLRWA